MVHYSNLNKIMTVREYCKILSVNALMLLLISMAISCSESPEPEPSIIKTPLDKFDELKKEYNITKEGLFLESASYGIDTMQLFINGRFNESLWIGCYDKSTKKQIFEWIEKEKLDTIFHFNVGYGEYSDFKVKDFHIICPYYTDGQLYFILWGYDPDIYNAGVSGRLISSDLYFVKNNNLTKKRRSFTYPDGSSIYYNIRPWYNSIFSQYAYAGNTNICFSSEGDSLYIIEKTISENYEPINIEECILNSNDNDKQGFNFERLNLKTEETVWSNYYKLLESIPANDRLDNTIIEKNNGNWTYSFFYTAFTDGAKYTIRICMNIETGEFISIE